MSYHIAPAPRISLLSTVTQSFSVANTSTAVSFTSAAPIQGFSWSSTASGQVNSVTGGDFFIMFSAIFNNSTTSEQTANVWLNYNGTDVAASNTTIKLSSNTTVVSAAPFIYTSTAGGYFQLNMSASSTAITMIAVSSAGGAPFTPSMIATIHKISK